MCIVFGFPSHSLFPLYSTGKRTYQLFHILDNSDNLNSVYCLYLLFVYVYSLFFICFISRGPHGRMAFMPNVSPS